MFNSHYDLLKEFLRFSKKFFSNNKADKNNNPSLNSCLLRIPGSINFKYNNKVKVVQKWNGYRPLISEELLEDFRTYLIQKNIEEHYYRQKISKVNRYYNKHSYYNWIENKILTNPFEECRKTIVDLILAFYLINIRNLSYEESYKIIREWLDKCDVLEPLDTSINFNFKIRYALKNASKRPEIGPMRQERIKVDDKYSELCKLLKKKNDTQREKSR